MDVTEGALLRLHRLLKFLRDQPSLRNIEYECGTIYGIPGEHCKDKCCEWDFDLDDGIDALADILGIQDKTPEEIAAEEVVRFEEGRRKFIEAHPECMSEVARGPGDREGN